MTRTWKFPSLSKSIDKRCKYRTKENQHVTLFCVQSEHEIGPTSDQSWSIVNDDGREFIQHWVDIVFGEEPVLVMCDALPNSSDYVAHDMSNTSIISHSDTYINTCTWIHYGEIIKHYIYIYIYI